MQLRHSARSTSALITLREHTQDAHRRLHELEVFSALLAGRLGRARYATLLACLHAYYQRVDAVLQSACVILRADQFNYHYCARTPFFARDLVSLGAEACDNHSHVDVLPPLHTPAALAGALYVIEGSLLGGATLDRAARRVLACHDDGDTAGRAYWSWCREVAAQRWQRTTTLIDTWLDTAAQTRQAVTTASATFEQLHAWLLPLAEPSC
jgi:heme oxygenase